MSNGSEGPSTLQMASTKELLGELMSRVDQMVLCMKTSLTLESGDVITRFKGDQFTCVGLADFLLERAREVSEDILYEIDDGDRDSLGDDFGSDP